MKLFVLVLIAVSMLMDVSAQQSATIIPVLDNTIYNESGTSSNGAGAYLFSGRTNGGNVRRALVKFALTDIPSNATITSVSLAMRVSRVPSSGVTGNFSLRKITADWGEGTSDAGGNEGGGANATTNDATWSHRLFNTQTWTNPGGDFSATVSATTSIAGVGSYTWASTPELVADVQGWLSNPSSNFGWIIIGDETTNLTAKRFDSRSSTTSANRPVLTVQYSASTSVGDPHTAPVKFSLEQNYPNPFNPSTKIAFSLEKSGYTTLTVFDLLGNVVAKPVDGTFSAGRHSVLLQAGNLASGVYYYQLRSGSTTATKKLMLIQ